jgi:hypothetical protein
MKLDQTFISIRKRSVSELFDLALTVVRSHWRSLLILLVLGAAPWILLDCVLLWQLMHFGPGDSSRWACSWLMMLLVVSQAQYGTSLITIYLGEAMFVGQPDWKQVARRAFYVSPLFVWLHGCLRMAFPVILLTWLLNIDQPSDFGALVGLFIPALVALGLAFRAFRPFVTEIILLEKTPWRPKDENSVSFARRSKALHSYASSELFGRFVICCLFAAPLSLTFQSLFVQIDSLLNLSAGDEWTFAAWYWIVSLWLTAGFIAVFRFLSYIDIRIRQEGWAIELKMRAEGQKLAIG